MTNYAYCDGSGTIWEFDSTHPAQPPLPMHDAADNIYSLAVNANAQFDIVFTREIAQTQGSNPDTPLYDTPGPGTETGNFFIRYVRVRTVPGEGERLYFSAYDGNQAGTDRTNIYYLKNGAAVLYTTIDSAQITARTLCNPAVEVPSYTGDFAFGDGDTLYLSTGNLGGSVVMAGIYRIDGAGPDSASNTPERIYLGMGPIQGLYYRSPQTLLFVRENSLVSLDLTTMTETIEGQLLTSGHPYDVAEIGAGGPHSAYSHIATTAYRSLTAVANVLLLAARKMISPGRPGWHPDPQRQALLAQARRAGISSST